MNKLVAFLLALLLMLTGCAQKQTDYPAAIMAGDTVYLKSAAPMPAEIEESAIIGYTSSYTDSFPEKDGETNFGRELGLPYAEVEGGIAVLCDNEWYLCTPMDTAGFISFYTAPAHKHEARTPDGAADVKARHGLDEEQAAKLNEIIGRVERWTDDYLTDRVSFSFDGEFELSCKEHTCYFTYEYNVIYFDHYFAEIPDEDMEYIMSLDAR